MERELAVVVFGVASALSWGAADFSGGLAARRTDATSVVIGAQGLGLPIAATIAVASGEPFLSLGDIAWATAASTCGTIALVAFYRALSLGWMSVAATVGAVVSAGFPVVVGAALEGLPTPTQFGGIVLGIASIAVVSLAARTVESAPAGSTSAWDPDARRRTARLAIGLAMAAGLGFGGYYVFIDQVSEGSVFWPLTVGRLFGLALLVTFSVARRARPLPARRAVPLVVPAAILDLGGTAFFILAAQSGRLDVAALLSSLYPVATILLAAVLLRERPTPLQGLGVVGAIAAIVLIALP